MQQTKTTMRLSLPRPLDQLDRLSPTALALCIFGLLVCVGAIGRITSVPAGVAPAPTPALPVIVIRREPAAAQLPAPAQLAAFQPAPVRYVTAWAAPDGDVLGAIPWNADSALLGRWGDNWILSTWQQGQVWVRASDVGVALVDLAPQIAPQPVYVSAPAAPQQPGQAEQEAQPPAAAPTPAAVYNVANERQQNIQNRMVEPVYPTLQPMEQNSVTQEWARQQWAAEH